MIMSQLIDDNNYDFPKLNMSIILIFNAIGASEFKDLLKMSFYDIHE